MENATIKDVAKEANVSFATVSRVLNKTHYVSPDLEKKVMEAVKKLNYYPNSVARSLKKQSTKTIGLIVSDIANGFFSTMIRSTEDIVKQHNYNLIVCSTDNKPEKEYSYIQLLIEKQVDGIIINITGENNDFITSLSENIPIALCGRRINNPTFKGDYVDSDNVEGSFELTRNLLEKGHRKIAIINGQSLISSAQERMEGFCKAMATEKIVVDADYPYVEYADFTRADSGYQSAKNLMERADPPTAIIAMNNELAIGAMKYFKKHQVSIPEALSFGCYGDIPNVELLYIQPFHAVMDARSIGNRLGELIVERIELKNQVANREIRFSPRMILGNTLKQI